MSELYKIPDGWEVKRLGEVLTIERGGSPRPIKKYLTNSADGINWIKIADATASDKYIYETKEKITRDGLRKTRVVNKGDFILSNSMSFGRPYIMATMGCIHDGWLVLRQNRKKIFEKWWEFLRGSSPYVFQQFNTKAAGSTVRNLNIALVRRIAIPIPPLPEQQRIVEILDKAFFSIDNAKLKIENNLRNVKEVFESYLNQVFNVSTTDEYGLTQIKEGWKQKTLGEISNVTYGFTDKSNEYGNYRYIRITDIDNNGQLILTNKKYINLSYEAKNFILKENDILMARTGATFAKLLLYKDFEPSIFASYLIKIDFTENIYNELYWFFTKSNNYWKQANSLSTGSAQPHFNGKALKQVVFSYPESIENQKELIKRFRILQTETKKLETIYQQKLDNLEELKKSILQKAFRGELSQ